MSRVGQRLAAEREARRQRALAGATVSDTSLGLAGKYSYGAQLDWERAADKLAAAQSSAPNSMGTARRLGVKRRWDWESLFVEHDAPGDIANYTSDGGVQKPWSEEETKLIAAGKTVPGIHGHHKTSASAAPNDTSMAADQTTFSLPPELHIVRICMAEIPRGQRMGSRMRWSADARE